MPATSNVRKCLFLCVVDTAVLFCHSFCVGVSVSFGWGLARFRVCISCFAQRFISSGIFCVISSITFLCARIVSLVNTVLLPQDVTSLGLFAELPLHVDYTWLSLLAPLCACACIVQQGSSFFLLAHTASTAEVLYWAATRFCPLSPGVP